jgi:hypothetical protein
MGVGSSVSTAFGTYAASPNFHHFRDTTFLAKNRFSLPDTLPFTWQDFAAAMPHFDNGPSQGA